MSTTRPRDRELALSNGGYDRLIDLDGAGFGYAQVARFGLIAFIRAPADRHVQSGERTTPGVQLNCHGGSKDKETLSPAL